MFVAKKQTQSNIPLIPKGTYQAVCYGVIDIGTHYSEKFKNESHQFIVNWEIPRLRLKYNDRDGVEKDSPRVISKTYSMTLGKKSNLRADLVSWFGEEPQDNYDPRLLLKENCLLTIVHKVSPTSQEEKAVVGSIASLMDGMSLLEPENQIISYVIEEDGVENYPNLPQWIIDQIKSSKEYIGATDKGGVADVGSLDNEQPPPSDDSDGIPF